MGYMWHQYERSDMVHCQLKTTWNSYGIHVIFT